MSLFGILVVGLLPIYNSIVELYIDISISSDLSSWSQCNSGISLSKPFFSFSRIDLSIEFYSTNLESCSSDYLSTIVSKSDPPFISNLCRRCFYLALLFLLDLQLSVLEEPFYVKVERDSMSFISIIYSYRLLLQSLEYTNLNLCFSGNIGHENIIEVP